MKFVRQEQIITTVINEKVSDKEEIKIILNKLKENKITFSLSIRKHFNSDYDYHIINHSKTRVKKVNENTVDFLIFTQSATISLKNILFEDITEVFAITKKKDLLRYNNNITKWDLMDIEEDEGENE